MFDIEVRLATCKVVCGDESGTGFLVADDRVLTARHCVRNAIEGQASIALTFRLIGQESTDLLGTVIADDEKLDICLVSLHTPVEVTPLSLSANPPGEGREWTSFGFPHSKPLIGHRIFGFVETLHDKPIAKVDTDLSVASSSCLQSYYGLSGGPVVMDGCVVGVLRLRMDNSLAAISVGQLSTFLQSHDVPVRTVQERKEDASDIAERVEFQGAFESLLEASAGRYVFLEGPHGIGKSTFCRLFTPVETRLLHLGTFCVRESAEANIAVNSQPSVFYDWLVATVSNLLTGRPERQTSKNYTAMAADVQTMLARCGEYCAAKGTTGVLFVDGLNDIASISEERLKLFVGLLPSVLPENVVVVFAAPNFAAVASALDSRVDSAYVTCLPPLPTEACRQFVHANIADDRREDFAFVKGIVDKAAGHPLYLNYLIRHANHNPADTTLDDFPVLDGSIESYYERLWQGLLPDGYVVNLLAIISRLRQPIPASQLFRLLESHEQAAFSPTLSHIQHLFLKRGHTAIYHDSFRVFLVQHTEAAHEAICERLATFCVEHDDIPYCVLNRVHHLLSSNKTDREKATQICQQGWVDACVLLSVQPDVLLNDLNRALKAALDAGKAVESIRLLLLVQRVSFRYDSLFAHSAGLVAKALISLGRPADALDHVLRHDQLIVSIQEALQISWALIEGGFVSEAIRLLNITRDRCIESYSHTPITVSTFVGVTVAHILGVLFLRIAGGREMEHVAFIQRKNIELLSASLQDAEPDFLAFSSRRILGVPNLYFLTFKDIYVTNEDLHTFGPMQDVPREHMLHMRLDQLVDHFHTADRFELSYKRESTEKLLADIHSTVEVGEKLQRRDIDFIVDALIRAGASESLVCQMAADNDVSDPEDTIIRDDNGVDANNRAAHRNNMLWRIRAFTDDSVELPGLLAPTRDTWQHTIEKLFDVLAILDGKARRALVCGDNGELDNLWGKLRHDFLPTLDSTLADRIRWQRSYAIPETALPFLLTLAIEVVESCFPSHMPEFIDWILERCPQQLGMYSEGFRDCLYQIAEYATRAQSTQDVELKLFELAKSLKRHAIECVENRHELVPELLRVIPLFVRLGAHQEAEATYSDALRMSMGPTWYKEDQFRLLTTAFGGIPSGVDAPVYFPRIAGLLERASGEMTFQRFVRYQKAEFVGLLAGRQELHAALWYFKSQTCGEPAQLFREIGGSEVDRAGPLHGNRHPGGALDEQDTILRFVTAARLDWRLRWALLEAFQIGDYRHTDSFASAFAALFNESAGDATVISAMTERIHYLVSSDLPDTQAHAFATAFVTSLDESLAGPFAELVARFPERRPAFPAPAAPSSSEGDEKEQHAKAQGSPRDELFFPGVFGRHDAFDRADVALEEVRREITFGNLRAAHEKLIAMLAKVQESQWSIWERPHSSTRQAMSLLRNTSNTSTELVKCYRDLILNEQHAASWSLAEHLITETASLVTPDEATDIMNVVLEHIGLMVGECESQIASFEPLRAAEGRHDNDDTFRFIEWLLSHPKWIRREKAAEVLAWLSTTWEPCSRYLAEAFYDPSTMNDRNVGVGLLEITSRKDPIRVWEQLGSGFDIARLRSGESHAFRLCTLYRISSRAADAGSGPAADVAEQLKTIFRAGNIALAASDSIALPNWAECIRPEWQQLERVGVTSQSLLEDCASNLAATCMPHEIQEIRRLEDAVLTSFREPRDRPFSRWKARVIHALNYALTPYLTIDDIEPLCQILSPVNPVAPCLSRDPRFESKFGELYRAVVDGELTSVVQDADTFRLHYLEFGEVESKTRNVTDSPETHSIEIIAVVVAADLKRRGFFLPELTATFSSKEMPPSDGEDHETCATLVPTFAFLGTFTPAAPLDRFLLKVGATHEDCSQLTWRIGRSGDFDYFGRPIHEGCSLSIARESVQFQEDLKLAWIIKLDDQAVAMIDAEGNELF